jgi:hypothetical protein
MPPALAEALKEWHDFYLLLGTAAGTLVGLTFVAITVGAGVIAPDRETGLRAFTTPTVVHFAAILFACLFVLTPFADWPFLGATLLAEALIALAYSCWVWLNIRRADFASSVIMSDRFWYSLLPIIAYTMIAVAAAALPFRAGASLGALAGGLLLLLIAGIRNAWDMALWIVMRPR